MTYGDGTSSTHALTSLDVAGHEMTHGVTSNTANLNYTGESGGLNEATSDIFGTGVEFYANNSTDVGDYLIGEKIDINGDGTPLRYMDEPDKDGGSADSWYSGVGNLDVHYSSGPANHMFYLLSEGSGAKTINGVTYNSPTSDGVAVAGIGRAAALQIWYKALTTYMTSSTTYAQARTAALNAAAALYGSSSTQYAGVGNAFAGINVGSHITVPTTGVTVTNPGSQSSTVGTAVSLADHGQQHQQRHADLRGDRSADRPVDQQLHGRHLRHPDDGGHLQHHGHGDRQHGRHRHGVLHLDGQRDRRRLLHLGPAPGQPGLRVRQHLLDRHQRRHHQRHRARRPAPAPTRPGWTATARPTPTRCPSR